MSRIYTGQTFRVKASSLLDPDDVELVSPTVTITVTDPNGTTATGTVLQSGSSYYADFISDVVGKHIVRAAATSGSGVWKDEGQLQVYDFTT